MTAGSTLDRRADYVSAVAVELTDLAPDDRAELIEELDDHIAALLEDRPDADLVAELGTPRAYAAELRTAAGLTGARAEKTSTVQLVRDLARRVDARVPDGLRPWLGGLRPTWWVLRGYLVVAGLSYWGHQTWAHSGIGVLIPAPGGNWVVGALLAAIGAAASVRVATWRGLSTRASRGLAIGLAVVAVASALAMSSSARYPYPQSDGYIQTQYVTNCPIELSNLYAYDAAGKPIDSVRLFDQNGNPFDLSTFGCNSGQYAPNGDANAYPWPTATYGQATEPTGPPASLAPLPGATGSSSTDVTPSGTPTPTATPTR